MSSMLDQAIVDAQALREAALKNAEQAVIDKYAPEIKAAVESLLESTNNDSEVINEVEEMKVPLAASPASSSDQPVNFEVEFEFDPEDFNVDMGSFEKLEEEQQEEQQEEPPKGALGFESPEAGGGIDVPDDQELTDMLSEQEQDDEEDDLISELLSLLDEDLFEETIEEQLTVDTGEEKHGHFVTDAGTRKYDVELEMAATQSTEYKERTAELEKQIDDLNDSILTYQSTQDKLHSVITDMKGKLEEALVMNARLLYSNRILSDASLNERQKSKIVEAVAKARTIEEAKTISETLKETIAGSVKKGPKSLSESVNRKSNLSHVLPRRKQQELNETLDFASRMKKLAGLD